MTTDHGARAKVNPFMSTHPQPRRQCDAGVCPVLSGFVMVFWRARMRHGLRMRSGGVSDTAFIFRGAHGAEWRSGGALRMIVGC